MVFSSLTFIFLFLPVVLLLYKSISYSGGVRFRNLLIILSSLLFYFWGEGRGVQLLIGLAVINLIFGKLISSIHSYRRLILIIAVSINLLVLIFYKYLYWLVSSFTQTFSLPEVTFIHAHALPLGISFFTFHAISYLVDLYQHKIGEHCSLDFLTYYFMFPHLVAGPIVRFEDVRADLISSSKTEIIDRQQNLFAYGVYRFVIGLNKKVLIANSVATIADLAFNNGTGNISMGTAWTGMIAYTVQIYFDFSGYSDMAIGLAAMLGIRFHENFNAPYTCTSIRDFWRRWHISLSSWIRDYVYIPLGGSRCSKSKLYRNLIIAFLLCGVWHGAQSTFVLWGLYHGALLIIERTKIGRALEKLPMLIQHSYALLAVMLGWVLFRAADLSQAVEFLKSLILGEAVLDIPCGYLNIGALIAGICVALFGRYVYPRQDSFAPVIRLSVFALNIALFIVSIAVLYSGTRNPFIYFNF